MICSNFNSFKNYSINFHGRRSLYYQPQCIIGPTTCHRHYHDYFNISEIFFLWMSMVTGMGVMAQQLKAYTALAENMGLILASISGDL